MPVSRPRFSPESFVLSKRSCLGREPRGSFCAQSRAREPVEERLRASCSDGTRVIRQRSVGPRDPPAASSSRSGSPRGCDRGPRSPEARRWPGRCRRSAGSGSRTSSAAGIRPILLRLPATAGARAANAPSSRAARRQPPRAEPRAATTRGVRGENPATVAVFSRAREGLARERRTYFKISETVALTRQGACGTGTSTTSLGRLNRYETTGSCQPSPWTYGG